MDMQTKLITHSTDGKQKAILDYRKGISGQTSSGGREEILLSERLSSVRAVRSLMFCRAKEKWSQYKLMDFISVKCLI